MKIRIREGNDFDVAWAIKRAGVPEDLSTATSMKLTLVVYGLVIEHNLFTVTDNLLSINIPKEVATVLGDYRLIFEYILPDAGQPDGDLKCKTDVVPFRIVPFTAKADDIYTINVTSDIAIGLKGDKGDDGADAYQIWLDLGNVGTYEDFIAYLRQPAVDAGASISELEGEIQVSEGLRVQAESERDLAESERQVTIQEAVTATQEATTAASLADTARLAIQDDLDLKANQTDLAQLESDVEQLELYKPVHNKILNIHKYGVPPEITSAGEANLWKIDDHYYHPNLFRCADIRTPINGQTGRYFGVIIDITTTVNGFNTRDVNNTVVFQHESLTNANKKIIYVDLSIGDVDKTFLYLTGQVKIYDIFLTDEVPTFNLIPYEFNDTVEWEDLFWKERDSFTPVITPAYTYNVIAQPADIRLNSFKRYVFFRVRSSLPDTRPQTIYFDTLNNNAAVIKRSHVRWSREWAYVDLGENLDSIRYLRLLSYSGTQAQGGSWLQLYDMRTSDSLSLNAVRGLDYPSFETAFEGKDRKLDYFRVGSKVFTGSAPSVIRKDNDFTAGGWSDLSMYDYTGKKISFKEARKQKVVDLASRYLSCITPEGEMYFKNGTAIEKIDVETFLNSIQSHDGTGLDYSRLSYINLPTDATESEKQSAFDSMKAEWYQFTGTTEQVNPSGGKEVGQMFSNGSILFGETLVREDGTIATPVLKNPVAANPTHLIIKDESGVVLHEIPLYGNIAETYKWGSFVPNEGDINYAEPVKSIINFINGKTLTVMLPSELAIGNYKVVLRGRRFGTTLVDGDVEISSNDITLGTISLSGTGTKRALIDNEISVTTSSAINEIKMTLSCATEKPLTVGNGMSSDGIWGRTADGRFGTIVEYVPDPERGAGKCYLTQDYGETWEDVFDVGLNELFDGSARCHLHGARYDRYWDKLFIVGGDYDENRPFHHANISSETTIDNIMWEHEPINGDVYMIQATEQYCTVYPDVDHIHFGTDYTISGMWRMNRINRNVMTDREPSFIVASYRITHIPTSYFKADDGELFALSMLGASADVNEGIGESTYKSVRLDATKDGVTWKEVWRNDVGGGGFGMNAYMNVHYFGNKLFLHIYGDLKFSTNHSLVILDYK